MTNGEFAQLVESLERDSASKPKEYKRKVALLAGLGYFYIWFWLLVTAAVTIVLLVDMALGHVTAGILKLIIVFALLSFYVIKALWVKHVPPEGITLTRNDAPELFGMLDSIKEQLKTPKIHKILVTNEFNAAISQVPRLGIFGLYQNYLIIGLPLM